MLSPVATFKKLDADTVKLKDGWYEKEIMGGGG